MAEQPDNAEQPARQPITPAKRRRLQQCFSHGSKMAASGNFDYATEMFSQCISGDPGNLIYVQNFVGNLKKKYNNNKKGSKLATLRGAGARGAIKKTTLQKDWDGVLKHGMELLKLNPWDTSTLTAMATACGALEFDDAQLAYLRQALEVDIKATEINRQAGRALARQGKFDDAIVCWTRVHQAKSDDAEAMKAIGDLTVEKTIQKGGYENAESATDVKAEPQRAADARQAADTQQSPEKRLEKAIAKDPADSSNYLQLAELHLHNENLKEAEEVLARALEASGGELSIRERLEDVQVRFRRHQVAQGKKRAESEKTPEAIELFRKLADELNRFELEVFRTRCDRYPANMAFKYELGLRLKRAKMFREAIKPLQAAREDPRFKGEVLLSLGECFQQIKQYKLAMSNYEGAVKAITDGSGEGQKLALYRAGGLAMALKDLDKADQFLTELAGLEFDFKDVAERLDKIAELRDKG